MNQVEENPYASPLTIEPLSEEVIHSLEEHRWKIAKTLVCIGGYGCYLGTCMTGIILSIIEEKDFRFFGLITATAFGGAGVATWIHGKIEKRLEEIRKSILPFPNPPLPGEGIGPLHP